MMEARLDFHSGGELLGALIRRPDPARFAHPVGGVVHAPGWMSRKDATHYHRYHQALTDAGLAVLIFDYRGVRRTSEGASHVSLFDHLADLWAATMVLRAEADVPSDRVAVLGSGAAGGALAVYLAAIDESIRCVAAISAFADGRDWLRHLRSDAEWGEYVARVEENRHRRARGFADAQVDPIEDIVRRSSSRSAISFKADIADSLPATIGLSAVDSIFAINPVDLVHRIAPRAIHLFAADSDVPVPRRHATALYDRASAPKALWILRATDGYRLHATHGQIIARRLAAWCRNQFGLPALDDKPSDEGAPLITALEELR